MNSLLLPAPRHHRDTWGDEELDLLTRLVYHQFFGLFYRHRFRMALSLLPESESLLEVGCGYGLLLPSLLRTTEKLHAVDVHPYLEKVREVLEKEGLSGITLRKGSIFELPYENESFDSVVCLSVLEQLADLERPVYELGRVLKKHGTLIVGVPVKNALTKVLFRWVNRDDDVIHPQSHASILAALEKQFAVQRITAFPALFPAKMGLYFVARCVKQT